MVSSTRSAASGVSCRWAIFRCSSGSGSSIGKFGAVSYVFQFSTVWRELDHLLFGAWLTVRLSAIAMALGLVVGLAGAEAKVSRYRFLRGLVQVYIEAIRN